MNARPAILCPVDFSTASAWALRYAAAIASHSAARLIVLTVVESPHRAREIDLSAIFNPVESETRLRRFVDGVFDGNAPVPLTLVYQVGRVTPAAAIVRTAADRSCDLIVMSTHGSARTPAAVISSTTEAVLRQTTTPVLVTPPRDPGHIAMEDAKALPGRIVVPVDLSMASAYQVRVARGIAEALTVPLLLVHVLPERVTEAGQAHVSRGRNRRRAAAQAALALLGAAVPPRLLGEASVLEGDAAQEIANFVRHREAGLVVMGSSGPPNRGPRMGSVTHRLLCLYPTLVLALPVRYEVVPTIGVPAGEVAHHESRARLVAV